MNTARLPPLFAQLDKAENFFSAHDLKLTMWVMQKRKQRLMDLKLEEQIACWMWVLGRVAFMVACNPDDSAQSKQGYFGTK
jgi:hypothetical protein